jgi:predicted esterase
MSLAQVVKYHPWQSAAIVTMAVALLVRYWPGEPSSALSETAVEKHGASQQLVVMVHGGLGRGKEALYDINELVKELFPDADILFPAYHGGRFVNTNAYAVASELESLINRTFEGHISQGHRYERIILIGYSVGGLLLRKAYVYGLGSTEDRVSYLRKSQAHTWTQKVERIVLAAGMNRGWSVDPPPQHMRWPVEMQIHIGKMVGRALRIGQFIRGFERGAPFVSDLRMQWVRLANTDCLHMARAIQYHRGSDMPDSTASALNPPVSMLLRKETECVSMAPAIQLLGNVDNLVSSNDNKDLNTVTSNFVFIPIESTDHSNVLDFQEKEFGDIRKQKVMEALIGEIVRLQVQYGEVKATSKPRKDANAEIDHIVFVMHGIRDNGEWTQVLANRIQQTDDATLAITSKYGRFPMGPFLLFEDRQKNVRWFMDQYTEAIAENPAVLKSEKGRGVSFIGHSNGTYLLASALQRYHSIEVNRVAFAGSVVPRKFPWDELMRVGRVKAIRNDLANKDWIVAIFPGFFEQFYRLMGIGLLADRDIGSGGFNGFEDFQANRNEAYYIGSHSVAIEPHNFDSLVKFIQTGKVERPHAFISNNGPNVLVSWLNNLAWLVVLVLAVVVHVLGKLFVHVIGPVIRKTTGPERASIVGWAIYLCAFVWLLYTL